MLECSGAFLRGGLHGGGKVTRRHSVRIGGIGGLAVCIDRGVALGAQIVHCDGLFRAVRIDITSVWSFDHNVTSVVAICVAGVLKEDHLSLFAQRGILLDKLVSAINAVDISVCGRLCGQCAGGWGHKRRHGDLWAACAVGRGVALKLLVDLLLELLSCDRARSAKGRKRTILLKGLGACLLLGAPLFDVLRRCL